MEKMSHQIWNGQSPVSLSACTRPREMQADYVYSLFKNIIHTSWNRYLHSIVAYSDWKWSYHGATTGGTGEGHYCCSGFEGGRTGRACKEGISGPGRCLMTRR